MIIIQTKLFFKRFNGLAIWPFIFVRNKHNTSLVNHERIHIRQQIELLFIGFYIWYLIEYIRHGYDGNCFELEAYVHQDNYEYLKKRPMWNFRKY